MKRGDPGLEPELEAFLEPRRIERRAPADLRARALARGRAILAAGGAIPTAPEHPLPPAVPGARGHGLLRIAVAAAIALVVGAVGAVAALRGGAAHAPQPATPASPHVGSAVRGAAPEEPSREPPAAVAVEQAPAARAARPARAPAEGDRFTAEIDLLQRAHAAYTRREFSLALALLAEHAHRFPRGHLAEQREALRVRSLAGSGRKDEAHRAAAAFAARFPRSVLLPRVEDGSDPAP